MKNIWEQNPLHGRCAKIFKDSDVDIVKTNRLLKSAGLKVETEGLIIAAQDESLLGNYQANIIKRKWIKPNM